MLPEQLLEATLILINAARQATGYLHLAKLLPGALCFAACDVIANSLRAGTPFNFSSLPGWISVSDGDAAKAIGERWKVEYHPENGGTIWFIQMPDTLISFAVDFDNGFFPDLITSPVKPVCPIFTAWGLF